MSFVRRPVQIVAAVLVLMLGGSMLSACGGGEARVEPYGDPADKGGKDYYDNFMFGCTGVEADPPGDTPTEATAAYASAPLEGFDYCKCVYDGMKNKVPKQDAVAFEDAQAKATEQPDGTYDITIPKNVQAVMASCSSDKG